MGFEPTAFPVTGERSNQLSYTRITLIFGQEPPKFNRFLDKMLDTLLFLLIQLI